MAAKLRILSVPGKPMFAAGLLATLALTGCNRPDGQMSDSAAANAPKESSTLGKAFDDTAITAKVKQRLASDERTKGTDISVETNNGVVTLTGTANSPEGKSAAEDLARNVAEVQGIDNKIMAPSGVDAMASKAENAADKAGTAIADAAITTKVKAKFAADDTVKATDIKVETDNGVVKLRGMVANDEARDRAVGLAKGIEGVKSVDDDDLRLSRS